MRGISEKTLQQKLESLLSYQEDYELLKELIEECKELNPWLPIDENTPVNRYLLCLSPAGRKEVLRLDWHSNTWRTQAGLETPYIPTHYQELSDGPESGDENARNT